MQVEAPEGVPDAEAAEVPGCRLRLCRGVFLCSLGKWFAVLADVCAEMCLSGACRPSAG